jgi:hypothetical protein
VTLETYQDVSDLYLARGKDVNANRPIFTGDVFANVPIAGVQGGGMAVLVAHPCSMRGSHAKLRDRILTAAVHELSESIGSGAWKRGHYDEMPLPEVNGSGLHVGQFSEIGQALTEDLAKTDRLACLSVYGVNLLQQRFIWNLTRFEVPTFRLNEAFAHTLEEADLLEDWNEILRSAEITEEEAAATFESFIRQDQGNGRTLQADLRDPQLRAAVRTACRNQARRIVSDSPGTTAIS